MKINRITILLLFVVFATNNSMAADLNTIMMEATCKISGSGSLGTGFVIGTPDKENPKNAFYTLITANHVFRAVKGDSVVLTFRQKQKDESWRRIEILVPSGSGRVPGRTKATI